MKPKYFLTSSVTVHNDSKAKKAIREITTSKKALYQAFVTSTTLFLLRPGRGAEYCDQFVCLSVCLSVCVCLSVREHISGTAGPIFTIFCADPLWPWLGPPLAALRYVMYTSGFMDDVTMGRNGPYGDG